MSFRWKISILLTLSFTALILLLAAVIYPRALEEKMAGLQQKVTAIAATGALTIDGEAHQNIPADPSALDQPAYQELQSHLRRIWGANPGVRYVWTMVSGRKPGETIFVGDVGGSTPRPGLRYDASHIPGLLSGFKTPSSDSLPVKDSWGISLSGYAPIRNKAGQVVGILGVDVYGSQLYRFQQEFRRFFAFSLLLGILLSLLVGSILGRWIAQPLHRLVHGMRQLQGGALSHELDFQRTDDEFAEAGNTFNQMATSLRKAREEIQASFIHAIQSLISALEAKDPYTQGHSVSVTQYAVEIARTLGKTPEEIATIDRLAVLHDIGKIGIHDAILQKPSSFTEEERSLMQHHPEIGGKILAPLGFTPEELALIVNHHEREDGNGYPQQLDHTTIPDLVAIVSVADAYDAMTSPRPYRRAVKPSDALAELRRKSGTQFRPKVVEALSVVLQRKGLLTTT